MSNMLNNHPVGVNEYENLEKRYSSARSNLLLVVFFTIVNVGLMLFGGESYFLFSACVPYNLVLFGMMLSGRYIPEWLTEEIPDFVSLGDSVFFICSFVAVIIIGLYALSWFLSKKFKVGWLIFALVFFSIDSLVLLVLGGINVDSLIDIVFHVWIIISLSLGIHAYFKRKKLPVPEIDFKQPESVENIVVESESVEQNSIALREADLQVKHRILAQTEALGHSIVYRRVKRVNELIVDGYVYDRYEALMEMSHRLQANVDGHEFVAEFDGVRSYLYADGQCVVKKTRLM